MIGHVLDEILEERERDAGANVGTIRRLGQVGLEIACVGECLVVALGEQATPVDRHAKRRLALTQ